MVWQNLAMIVIGFIVLVFASRVAIKSIARISRHFSAPEFTVSFILFGILSTLPEFSVAINSAISNSSSFGLGVLLGSNIADLTLVIGLVAIASGGISIHKFVLKNVVTFSPLVVLPLLLLFDGELSRLDGAVLVAAFFAYLWIIISKHPKSAARKENANLPAEVVVVLLSIAVIFTAGNLVSENAVMFSSAIGIPIFFLGVLVAIGTCMPELNFAVQASKTRHGDMAFGDILGNVFADSLLSIGVVAMINPIRPAPHVLAVLGAGIMALSMLFLVLLVRKSGKISRATGFGLVLVYIVVLLIQIFAEQIFVAH